MQQIWTVLQHLGPNHLGMAFARFVSDNLQSAGAQVAIQTRAAPSGGGGGAVTGPNTVAGDPIGTLYPRGHNILFKTHTALIIQLSTPRFKNAPLLIHPSAPRFQRGVL